MTDWQNEPEVRRWFSDVLTEMVPKLRDSAISVSLLPQRDGHYTEGDAKYWVELGAGIMLDKPLIVLVAGDHEIPVRLRRVADEIVELHEPFEDPRNEGLVMEAIKRWAPDE
jgi:hypothetical protein